MKGTVLLVEDDEKVRHIYAYFLAQAEYKVIQAWSVATALMHLDARELTTIVLDLWLPNGHGREIVEALAAKRNDVPVVIISATPDEYKWDWPVVGALKKPAQRTPFLRAVADAHRYHEEGVAKLRETALRLRNLVAVQ